MVTIATDRMDVYDGNRQELKSILFKHFPGAREIIRVTFLTKCHIQHTRIIRSLSTL